MEISAIHDKDRDDLSFCLFYHIHLRNNHNLIWLMVTTTEMKPRIREVVLLGFHDADGRR